MARYGYGGYGEDYGGWAPYVSVAERRRNALKEMAKLRKKGVDIQPVAIEGRKIARSFWGEAWCDHLESFSDFANRLPRGQRYVRNGSVCHLAVGKGTIEAKVSGSELYDVEITIKTLPAAKWKAIKGRCSGQIGSLLELLEGRLSDHVMEQVTDQKQGLFPLPDEISMECSCPDWASMCKHIAAVLYGVGARLDHKPEMLFLLRGVDHEELIAADAEQAMTEATSRGKSKRLSGGELADVFGIEIGAAGPDGAATSEPQRDGAAAAAPKKRGRPAGKKTAMSQRAKQIPVEVAVSTPAAKASARNAAAKKVSRAAARKTFSRAAKAAASDASNADSPAAVSKPLRSRKPAKKQKSPK